MGKHINTLTPEELIPTLKARLPLELEQNDLHLREVAHRLLSKFAVLFRLRIHVQHGRTLHATVCPAAVP